MARLRTVGICEVALTAAYRAAILLTGSARTAEGAVLRAIESMDIDAANKRRTLAIDGNSLDQNPGFSETARKQRRRRAASAC